MRAPADRIGLLAEQAGIDVGQPAIVSELPPLNIPRKSTPLVTKEARVLRDERGDALVVGRLRPEDVKRCFELQDEKPPRRKSVGHRHDVSSGLERELGEPGGELALPPEELHRTGIVEVVAGIGRVEDYSASGKKMFGCVHLPCELEPFRDRSPETLRLEIIVRETELEAVVSSMAKVRSEQAGELAVDRQEDEPRPVSPASIEMLPSRDARKSRHEFGRPLQEIMETPGSPLPSQQAQADEFAPLGGRQPEDRSEVAKKIAVLAPHVPLNGRPATKELEPPRVDAQRDLVALATPLRLVDEPLRAVEPLSIELGAEMLPDVAFDRFYEVYHGRFTSNRRY